MAATNSAFVDEIVVNVEPDDHEDGVEDHLNCSAASSSSAAAANEPDLSGISGSQTPGQQQNRNMFKNALIALQEMVKCQVCHEPPRKSPVYQVCSGFPLLFLLAKN